MGRQVGERETRAGETVGEKLRKRERWSVVKMEETETGNMVRIDKDRGMETLSARKTERGAEKHGKRETGQTETEGWEISSEKRQRGERCS